MVQPSTPRVDRPAIRLAIIYAVFGAAWILFSDRALAAMVSDAGQLAQMEIYKGWFFILITAILLYLLIRAELRKRHRLEVHLRQQHKIEAIGMLAAGVAHEINNPLTGIGNYAQMIHDEASPGSETRVYAHEVIREAQRVGRIVRNLLMVARHDPVQQLQTTDIRDIVEDTLSLVRALIRRDSIDLEVNLAEDLPTVQCDPQQLQQVLLNLVTNARDAVNAHHGQKRGIKRITVTAATLTEGSARWLRLSVGDNGHGIDPALLDRVLDPFFTTKSRDAGTGLGLSICNSIVVDHGGRLNIESRAGHGTTVHVDLPLAAS